MIDKDLVGLHRLFRKRLVECFFGRTHNKFSRGDT
jgi:hypothetical protein